MAHHDEDELREYPVVFLPTEGVFGIIVNQGAFVSRVKYYKDGISYEVLMDNGDFYDE